MELRQLQYFVHVARHESLSLAARELSVSQPTVSKAIANLERELGVSLFSRYGKRLHINEKGLMLQIHAEHMLRELEQTTDAIAETTKPEYGQLKICVFGQQAYAIECLTSFLKQNPNVSLIVDTRKHDATNNLLDDYDLIFYPDAEMFANINGTHYKTSRVGICVNDRHPAANATEVDLLDFKDAPFILMNSSAGMYEQCFNLCVESGFTPYVRTITNSGIAHAEFIRAGLGVGFVTDDANAFKDSGLARLELKQSTSETSLCFATRNPNQLSPLAQILRTFVFSYFKLRNNK